MSVPGEKDDEIGRYITLAYYRWTEDESAREVKSECGLVRLVRGRIAIAALDLMARTPQEGRLALMRSISRHFNHHLGSLAGDVLDESDRSAHALWRRVLLSHSASDAHFGGPSRRATGHGVEALVEGSRLEEIFIGASVTSIDTRTQRLDFAVGDWMLATTIERASNRISYFHDLISPSGTKVLQNISLLSWLGFHSTTAWDVPPIDDDAAGNALRLLCQHFLKAVSGILLYAPEF